MNAGLLLVVLAIGWVAVTGAFTLPNLLLGMLIAAIVLSLFRRRLAWPSALRTMPRVISLMLVFIRELVLSTIGVARLALTPRLASHLAPAIIAFPLTAKSDAEITLLANLVTLTPGTLSLDISADRSFLYIHVLRLEDRQRFIDYVATVFEKKVMDVFR